MTATLTDHHGAIDPHEFNADHPEARPFMSARQAAMLASDRLWGSSSSEQLDRDRPRRLVAVGHTRNEDAGRPRDEGNRKWFEARHARDFERFDCAPLWVF